MKQMVSLLSVHTDAMAWQRAISSLDSYISFALTGVTQGTSTEEDPQTDQATKAHAPSLRIRWW